MRECPVRAVFSRFFLSFLLCFCFINYRCRTLACWYRGMAYGGSAVARHARTKVGTAAEGCLWGQGPTQRKMWAWCLIISSHFRGTVPFYFGRYPSTRCPKVIRATHHSGGPRWYFFSALVVEQTNVGAAPEYPYFTEEKFRA